ncbi:flagellar hook-basal body complex protein FliE [Chitinispirillales bacterium ANBcel5]|uniref:flagellar hook-basal body complex protein FliE n=1 Tax=Cellulosispirillum alkaliphilum TaxID=3039283 RepID=UPI002A4EB5AD|nr:flagellar hook-basal body complex protein FliE [Chitinispirillales bacterium ANBcel5]
MNINQIGPVGNTGGDSPLKPKKTSSGAPSFKDTMNGFLKDVNDMQNKADQSIKKMAAGEITDVHQVMSTVEEANVAFNMMMEIRNKVMDAYQEVMRIRL